MKKTILITLCGALSLLSANAASVAVTNFSFEDPGTGKISSGFATIAGWSDVSGDYGDTGVEPGGTEAAFNAYFQNNNAGAMQVTGHSIAAGDQITLEVDISWGGTIELFATDDGGTTRNVLDTELYNNPSDGSYTLTTLAFTTDATYVGQSLGIRIANEGTTHGWTSMDNVRLDVVPVPEPASSALLGLGGLALILRRRK